MALSSAFNSALSGLTAAGRASALVSENIANAMTPGYGRRTLNLASNAQAGPVVRVLGVQRHADPVIIANRRVADAEQGAASALSSFHNRFESLVGAADDPASIGMRLAGLETALLSAASLPDSAQRLNAAVMQAGDLARSISEASQGVQDMRMQADRSIGAQVDRVNQALSDIQKLNSRITSTKSSGGDVSALMDQRQRLVDEVNQIIPVNEVARDHHQIALYTDGGAILLDGPAARLSFTVTNQIVPEMTLAGGALSGLQINGIPVRTASQGSAIGGGSLAAQFAIRDELAISAQEDLDAVARDLVERFETPGLDPTAGPGDPGLFTDQGNAFDPLAATGLAGRLRLNALVDPAQGGESWRLRDGLGAASPGPSGDSRLLQAFGAVLGEARAQPTTRFGTGQMTASGLNSALLSRAAQGASTADRALSFASASLTELSQIELAQGVDTDAELQNLMLVEQAYAANARMIQVVDDMIETLMRL